MKIHGGRWWLAAGIILCLGCGAKDFMPINETFRTLSWVETNREPGKPEFIYKGYWAGERRRLECWVRVDTEPARLYFVSIYSGDTFAVVVRGRLQTAAKRGEYDIKDYPRDRLFKLAKEILVKGESAGNETVDSEPCRRFKLATDAGEKSSDAQVWVDANARLRQIQLTGRSDPNRFEQSIHSIRYDPPLDDRLFTMPVPREEPRAPAS